MKRTSNHSEQRLFREEVLSFILLGTGLKRYDKSVCLTVEGGMNEWEKMKKIDIRTISKESLEDITTLHIEECENSNMRRKDFVDKVKNPYCFRVGDVIVKSTFLGGASLKERIKELVN